MYKSGSAELKGGISVSESLIENCSLRSLYLWVFNSGFHRLSGGIVGENEVQKLDAWAAFVILSGFHGISRGTHGEISELDWKQSCVHLQRVSVTGYKVYLNLTLKINK